MSNIQVFNNDNFGELRTVEKDGEIWFVGSEVAGILGYTNTPKAIRDHVDDEDKLTERIVLAGQNREAVIINESGLYSLILTSKLSTAKEFKRWVTSEVLPSIRKTGSYTHNEQEENQMRLAERECKLREAELWLKIGDNTPSSDYKAVANAYAANTLAGKVVFSLPAAEKKTYSATEIAKILGVTSHKIGILANKNGLKTDEYGKLFYDKAAHSNKQVETFRYYETAIDKFRELLEDNVA